MPKRAAAQAKGSPYRVIPVNKYAGVPADDRRRQRRERLVAAGLRLFGSNGYANTTIAALSEASNCALRTFYEEFGSREALLLEIYDRLITSTMNDTIGALKTAGREPREVVLAGVDAYVRAVTSDVGKARIAMIEVVGVSREIEKRRRDAMRAFVDNLQHTIGELKRTPEQPAVDDPSIVILALAGASDELLTEWILSKGRLSTERLSSVLYGLWIRGLNLA